MISEQRSAITSVPSILSPTFSRSLSLSLFLIIFVLLSFFLSESQTYTYIHTQIHTCMHAIHKYINMYARMHASSLLLSSLSRSLSFCYSSFSISGFITRILFFFSSSNVFLQFQFLPVLLKSRLVAALQPQTYICATVAAARKSNKIQMEVCYLQNILITR